MKKLFRFLGVFLGCGIFGFVLLAVLAILLSLAGIAIVFMLFH